MDETSSFRLPSLLLESSPYRRSIARLRTYRTSRRRIRCRRVWGQLLGLQVSSEL